MYKIIYVSFFLFCTLGSYAQGILFEETQDLKAALAKAKAENKLVFVDAYADWCAPCKMMEREIFTQKEVGDFFNTHFINLKLNVDKYIDIAEKYSVKALPTYLFLDSAGNMQHIGKGLMGKEAFLELAANALSKENNHRAISKKIKERDNNKSVLKMYLLNEPNLKDAEDLVQLLFEVSSKSERNDLDLALLTLQHVRNTHLSSFQYLLKNKVNFERKLVELTGVYDSEFEDTIIETIVLDYKKNGYKNDKTYRILKKDSPEMYQRIKNILDNPNTNQNN